MPKQLTTITISIGADGTPTVTPPAGDDCSGGNPQKACGWYGERVEWTSAEDIFWVVAFDNGSPFNGGKRIFSNAPGQKRGGLISRKTNGEEWKYTVVAQKDGGSLKSLDPIVVIRDDTRDGVLYKLKAHEDDVTNLEMEAEELGAAAAELGATTRTLIEELREILGGLDEGSSA